MQPFYLSLLILKLAIFMTAMDFSSAHMLKSTVTVIPERFEIETTNHTCLEEGFVYRNGSSDVWCLMKCVQNGTNCQGVFSDVKTGRCVGCSVAVPSEGTYNVTEGIFFTRNASKKTTSHLPRPPTPPGDEVGAHTIVRPKTCDSSEWELHGSCYYITTKMPFQDAVNECRSRGADVAIIEDTEYMLIRAYLGTIAGSDDRYFATGLVSNKDVLNGEWVRFNTRTPVAYQPWHLKGKPNGEPNNSPNIPRCAVLYAPFEFEMADEYCQSENVRMICKK